MRPEPVPTIGKSGWLTMAIIRRLGNRRKPAPTIEQVLAATRRNRLVRMIKEVAL